MLSWKRPTDLDLKIQFDRKYPALPQFRQPRPYLHLPKFCKKVVWFGWNVIFQSENLCYLFAIFLTDAAFRCFAAFSRLLSATINRTIHYLELLLNAKRGLCHLLSEGKQTQPNNKEWQSWRAKKGWRNRGCKSGTQRGTPFCLVDRWNL